MDVRERFNPMTGLIIIISATLIAIFTMAILMEMKKRGAEGTTPKDGPKGEPLNPYMVKPEEKKDVEGVEKTRKVCDSSECITLSYQLLNWRDTKTDPCQDFHQFSCGKYSNPSEHSEKKENTIKLITEFLKKNGSTDSESMKTFYEKCEEFKNDQNTQNNRTYQEIFKDSQNCGQLTINYFPLNASRIFYQNVFEKENPKILDRMVEDTRNSFINLVNESSVFHEDSKKETIEKLKEMKKVIGFQEETADTLNFSPDDSFYTMMQKVIQFNNDRNPNDFFETTVTHSKTTNTITIMTPLIEGSAYPKYAKLASIGRLIAKEIGSTVEMKSDCQDTVIPEQVGLEAIWRVFKNSEYSEDSLIPGFKDEDLDRVFFQIYALNFCSEKSILNSIMSNSISFSKTFDCPIGAAMNPEKKCQIL